MWLLLLLLAPPPCFLLELRYHNTAEVERHLMDINATYNNFTHLHSIGASVLGRQLWVLVLGQSPRRHRVGIPEFKYIANMHGNEVLGRVLLLQLIDKLVQGYLSNDPSITRLLNSTRIHLLVSMNPDGYEEADTHCVFNQGRFNHNGVDLNRNFPDAFAGHQQKQEVEVRAVMSWLQTETFVLSANLHGGALVASYPYDNSNRGSEAVGGASVAPDNDVFIHLAKVFSYSHASMHHGNSCQDSTDFPEGITNGYQWYPLAGGIQDYNYIWAQCLELILEVSCCKFPPVNQLEALWRENSAALLAFIRQVHLGVKGRVLDQWGVPLKNAVVEVLGRKNLCPFTTNRDGEYYRLLLPGNHTIRVSLPGYQVVTETLTVPYGPDHYSALTHDFLLHPVAMTAGSNPPKATPTLPCSPSYTWGALNGGGATTRPCWLGIGLMLRMCPLIGSYLFFWRQH